MAFFRKNILVSIISILAVLLTVWFGGSLYLVSQTTGLLYHFKHSKDLQYSVPTRSEFLTLTSGESIEVLIAEAQNPELKQDIILYFHGNWGRNPKNIAELTKFGTVVSPAYPGFSLSTGVSNTKKINDTVQVTLDWFDSEGILPSNVTIFGHSLGGSPAVFAATRYPDARSLVLVNTFHSIQKQCQLQYGLLCVLTGSIHNTADTAVDINPQMPLQHFHNQNDDVIPVSEGRQLFDLMPNRDKKFSDISGTHGDINAEWVMQEILK